MDFTTFEKMLGNISTDKVTVLTKEYLSMMGQLDDFLIDSERENVFVIPCHIQRESTIYSADGLTQFSDFYKESQKLPDYYFGKAYINFFNNPLLVRDTPQLNSLNLSFNPVTAPQVIHSVLHALQVSERQQTLKIRKVINECKTIQNYLFSTNYINFANVVPNKKYLVRIINSHFRGVKILEKQGEI